MKLTTKVLGTYLVLTLCGLFAPYPARAGVEWTVKKQMNLEAAPLDVTTSLDGQYVFVLTTGEVLVYANLDNNVINRIPVDKTFDRLTYSAQDNTLILSSSAEKTLKFVQLETVYKFDTTGLAFKGPANAPVTIAVFSDYQ